MFSLIHIWWIFGFFLLGIFLQLWCKVNLIIIEWIQPYFTWKKQKKKTTKNKNKNKKQNKTKNPHQNKINKAPPPKKKYSLSIWKANNICPEYPAEEISVVI